MSIHVSKSDRDAIAYEHAVSSSLVNSNIALALTAATMGPNGIITSTPGGNIALTTPTGAVLGASFSHLPVGSQWSFSVVCLAAFNATVTAGDANVTTSGSMAVNNASGTFRVRKTGAQTFVIYRV